MISMGLNEDRVMILGLVRSVQVKRSGPALILCRRRSRNDALHRGHGQVRVWSPTWSGRGRIVRYLAVRPPALVTVTDLGSQKARAH